MFPARAFPLGIVFTAAFAAGLAAQGRTVTIPAAPQCATCSIELTKVATVGSATDPVRLVNYTNVYRGPANTILVSTTISATPPALLVYDSTGKFVRQVGRVGEGPGEFPTYVTLMGLGPGDSLHLRERFGRVHVFSRSFEFGRAIAAFNAMGPIPMGSLRASPTVVLPNGNYLELLRPSRGQPYAGPLRLISPDGARAIRTFGSVTPEENEADPTFSARYVGLSRDGSRIWVARRNQYDVQRYTLDGEREFAIKIEGSPWMKDWLTAPTAPFSSLVDVNDAGNNRVWVLGQVPSLGATAFIRPNTGAWPMRLEQNLSSVIEIIDTERGIVLASTRFENEIYLFIDGDHVVRQRQDAAGLISFDVFRITLRGR